jgi:hypothetical protein
MYDAVPSFSQHKVTFTRVYTDSVPLSIMVMQQFITFTSDPSGLLLTARTFVVHNIFTLVHELESIEKSINIGWVVADLWHKHHQHSC